MKKYKYEIGGVVYEVTVKSVDDDRAEVEVNGESYSVNINHDEKPASRPVLQRPAVPPVAPIAPAAPPAGGAASAPRRSAPAGGGAGAIMSPLPGVITHVMVKEGDAVKSGQTLMVLEAMKMENNIEANRDGKVTSIAVREGTSVMEGETLITIGD